MKKTLIILWLFLLAVVTKVSAQKLVITNTTSCKVTVNLLAQDCCINTGCGGWGSNNITVDPGTVTYNDETQVNTPSCPSAGNGPGWQDGCYPAADLIGTDPFGWQGAAVSSAYLPYASVGISACGYSSTSYTYPATDLDCSGGDVTIMWTDTGTEIDLTISY